MRKSAAQGLTQAQHMLGLMYAEGEGVPKNHAEANVWLRKAAEAGLPDAQLSLGLMHKQGLGVPPDSVAAYAWFSVAANSGNEDARKELSTLRPYMSKGQVALGVTLSREYEREIEASR